MSVELHGLVREFHVRVRGVSFDNPDGTSRQDIIKTLRVNQSVKLVADPLNPHDRYAVGVFTRSGQQIGFLPSDGRDSFTLLRGEPIHAVVKRLTGGTNWFRQYVLGKKHVGVVLIVTKPDPDWTRYTRLSNLAGCYDDAVKAARKLEKSGDIDAAIDAYQKVVSDIAKLNEDDRYTSAHRFVPTPVDRLSLLLERRKRYGEALRVIEEWQSRFDPIELHAEPYRMTIKRKRRLEGKLQK